MLEIEIGDEVSRVVETFRSRYIRSKKSIGQEFRRRESLFRNLPGPLPGLIARTATARAADNSLSLPRLGTASATHGSPSPSAGVQEPEKDVKPKLIASINLTLRDQANAISFKMKREKPLQKLMKAGGLQSLMKRKSNRIKSSV